MTQPQSAHSKLQEYQRKRIASPKSNPYIGFGIAAVLFIVVISLALMWYNNHARQKRTMQAARLEKLREETKSIEDRLSTIRTSVTEISIRAADLMPPVEAAVEFVLGEPLGRPPDFELGPRPPPPPPGVAVRPPAPAPPAQPPSDASGIRDDGTPVGIMSIEEMERRLRRERKGPGAPAEEAPAEEAPAEVAPSEPARAAQAVIPEIRQIGWKLLREIRAVDGQVERIMKDSDETEKRLLRFADTLALGTDDELCRRLVREIDDLSAMHTELEQRFAELPPLQAKALELREAEAAKRKAAEEQREQVEAERRRRALLRDEMAALDAAMATAGTLFGQNRFEDARRALTEAIEAVTVAQPDARHTVAAEAAGRLEALMATTVQRLAGGLRWGWKAANPPVDVLRADAAGVEMRFGRVEWERVPLQQMLVFFEFTLSDPAMGASVRAEYCIALAYLCAQLDQAALVGRYSDMALAAAVTPALERAVREDMARLLGAGTSAP